MRMKKSQEIPIDYACNACSYSTHIKKDYTKHLLTRKHKNRTDPNIIIHPDTPFECPACAKGYTSRNSLWYHKKKCVAFYNKTVSDALTNEAIIDISETGEIDGSGGDEVHTNTVIELDSVGDETVSGLGSDTGADTCAGTGTGAGTGAGTCAGAGMGMGMSMGGEETTSILHQMIEENKELRSMLHEQQKQIGEIIPKIGNTTNKFNLNVFLNEHCKDAISLHDFISNLELLPEDLENTGKLGYVDGIAKIINRGLQEMELTKRPIHCSDIKREVLYVKENDVWEKENVEKNRMRKAIEFISRANIKQIPSWVVANPTSQEMGNSKNNEYMKIIENVIDTHDVGEHSKNVTRIIKNVTKNVVLDK